MVEIHACIQGLTDFKLGARVSKIHDRISITHALVFIIFSGCATLELIARRSVHHLVNLVYRPTSPEGASKDDEFSRRSIEVRWLAGYRDTVNTLRHPDVLKRAAGCDAGIFVFDFPRDDG